MKVHLFIPCLVDQLAPSVGEATVRVLRRAGCEVVYDRRQTCCGQPAYNSGYRDEAARVARHFLSVFSEADRIVAPSGSCVAMVRNLYRDLAPLLPASERERVDRARERTFELCELLVDELGIVDVGARLPVAAAYHDSCHLLRELGVQEQPRRLLAAVRGLRLLPLTDSDRCCGFGGAFAVKLPDLSAAMGEEKARRVAESGAQVVVSADTGCMLQMRGVLDRLGVPVRVMHIAEVLASRGEP